MNEWMDVWMDGISHHHHHNHHNHHAPPRTNTTTTSVTPTNLESDQSLDLRKKKVTHKEGLGPATVPHYLQFPSHNDAPAPRNPAHHARFPLRRTGGPQATFTKLSKPNQTILPFYTFHSATFQDRSSARPKIRPNLLESF